MIASIPYTLVALALVAAFYDIAKRHIAARSTSEREDREALPNATAATELNKRLDAAEKRAEEVMRASVNVAKEASRSFEEVEKRIGAMETKVVNLASRGAIIGAQNNNKHSTQGKL